MNDKVLEVLTHEGALLNVSVRFLVPPLSAIGETTKRLFGIESGLPAQVAGGRPDADQDVSVERTNN